MRGGRFAHLNLTVISGDGLNQSGDLNLRFRLQRATNPLQIRWELQKHLQMCFGSIKSNARSEKFRIPARKVLRRTVLKHAGNFWVFRSSGGGFRLKSVQGNGSGE
ncbi:unnamed protein product [Victoria cruziana]